MAPFSQACEQACIVCVVFRLSLSSCFAPSHASCSAPDTTSDEVAAPVTVVDAPMAPPHMAPHIAHWVRLWVMDTQVLPFPRGLQHDTHSIPSPDSSQFSKLFVTQHYTVKSAKNGL
jgi:hypothetical protein